MHPLGFGNKSQQFAKLPVSSYHIGPATVALRFHWSESEHCKQVLNNIDEQLFTLCTVSLPLNLCEVRELSIRLMAPSKVQFQEY